MQHEPIFSRQEQGVVYLFSRYWNKIDIFKDKRIYRIHTHFPDFSIKDAATGEEEAIEFEYALSAFRSHLGHLQKLHELGIRLLYIVYWDHDDDETELRSLIRGQRRETDFGGKVKLVCLKDYFSAGIDTGPDCLLTSWVFSKDHLPKAYSFASIEAETIALEKEGAVTLLTPNKKLYRTSGFNKSGSAYIECDHWKRIHFYTTSAMSDQAIPSKLLLKPTGCHYFSGYFQIRFAFVIKRGTQLVQDYYRRYYFYPYHPDYRESTCFVYSDFTELKHEQGGELFKFLKGRVRIDTQGSKLIEPTDNEKIDAIMGE